MLHLDEQAREQALQPLAEHHARGLFYNLDLAATAALYAAAAGDLPSPLPDAQAEVMLRVQERMFRAAVLRRRGELAWEKPEHEAFAILRESIVRGIQATPVLPRCTVLEDQIVWGRAPLRLDLAGGWTDTPPYCLHQGGSVVNVAVELNGQPPVQVFLRRCAEPVLMLRSIDLGQAEKIATFADLRTFQAVGSGFSIARAALALAGFLPEYRAGTAPASLKALLQEFGGGLDLSFLAAVPKGSGLGTSSILAAAMLGALGDCCGLGWDLAEISRRTLALEQILTTGGGWQDQLGGLTRGLKLIETRPGLAQIPVIRWLPPYLFSESAGNGTALLYYTGVTRVAKNILQEIVRGMFLNSARHLDLLAELGRHARHTYDVILRGDRDGCCRAIARSWELNQRLDAGTNPPAIQAILDPIRDWVAGGKLLGAGGGGFLLLFAKDTEAAHRLRNHLEQHPPNPRARFINLSLSETGLQVTRS